MTLLAAAGAALIRAFLKDQPRPCQAPCGCSSPRSTQPLPRASCCSITDHSRGWSAVRPVRARHGGHRTPGLGELLGLHRPLLPFPAPPPPGRPPALGVLTTTTGAHVHPKHRTGGRPGRPRALSAHQPPLWGSAPRALPSSAAQAQRPWGLPGPTRCLEAPGGSELGTSVSSRLRVTVPQAPSASLAVAGGETNLILPSLSWLEAQSSPAPC